MILQIRVVPGWHLWMKRNPTVTFITDVREVFDLFDFWDGRDGDVDAAKTGDMLYCLGLNPTQEIIMKNGGVKKFGEFHEDYVTLSTEYIEYFRTISVRGFFRFFLI